MSVKLSDMCRLLAGYCRLQIIYSLNQGVIMCMGVIAFLLRILTLISSAGL